jgi:parallel beta-helix repeat protein
MLLLPRGDNGKPVTVEGEDGTVLVGSEPITGWTKTDNGIWVVKGWKGNYFGPSDPREWDVRSQPGNILFAGSDVIDYVATKADLAPGCWTLEPLEGHSPKAIYLCPPPGVDPNAAQMEIVVCGGLFQPSEFNHVRNLHFTRAGCAMGIGGRGHVIEHNRIDWMGGGAFGVYGQDIIIRNNRIEWTGGIGGACARVLFENNLVRFNAWRIVDGAWAGGAIKFIPGCVDHLLRGNEFAYNRTATVWYDSGNEGIAIEDNVMHDNQASGIFDEFGFGNTFRGNLIYNNGGGIYVANSCSERVERNVCFNNLGGIGLRGATMDAHKQTEAAKVKADADEIMSKWDVRRYQGMLTYEREKPYRDMLLKYCTEYADQEICRHNTFAENVVVDNGSGALEHAIARYPYGRPGVTVDPDAVNEYRHNYYGSSPSLGAKVAEKGAADLAAWQKASGLDVASVWVNPRDKAQMPKWYQKKTAALREGQLRPYKEIVDLTGGEVRKFNPNRLLLRGRLAESKYLKVVEFEDSGVRGAYFDTEGRRCLALWSRTSASMTDWVLPAGQKQVVVENKWLNRHTVGAEDGRISLYVTDDPIVLIGVTGQVHEDCSIILRIPEYTEPGKPVEAAIRLENQGEAPQPYALAVRWGESFDGNVDVIKETLAPGAKVEKALILTPKAGTGKGAYQLCVEGAIGGRKVKKTKDFMLGARNVVPKQSIHIDGDAADWDAANLSAEVADTKEQVLLGKDTWRGPADLSAKMRLAWADDYVLSMLVEVTDDKLVTNRRRDKPTESDSVQLFVDVRAPWKLYQNEYGIGAFQLVIVPAADGSNEPTVEFIGAPIAHTKMVATKRTPKGYNVEVRLRFRNMDEPGWVAGREIRVGALVNDSDDPSAGRKSVLGLWRTALDADKSCISLTRFTLQK